MMLIRKIVFITLCVVVCPIVGLFLFEGFQSLTDREYKNIWWQFPKVALPQQHYPLPVIGAASPLTVIIPNLNYSGPAPWERKTRKNDVLQVNITSNSQGLFYKVDLDSVGPKKDNEFRIVLVGGSGAQGHGASSLDTMLHSRLEEKLGRKFGNNGTKITVFNLAIAGYEALTIPPILSAFGHKLEPDLILAYVGANDTYQLAGGNAYENRFCRPIYGKLMRSNTVGPAWTLPIGEWFPSLLYKLGGLTLLKKWFYGGFYRSQANAVCDQYFDVRGNTLKERQESIFYNVSRPVFIESFKAIKRDFCGIPIGVAWQAIHEGERRIYNQMIGNERQPEEEDASGIRDIYQEFFRFSEKGLSGYINNAWYFINVDLIAQKAKNFITFSAVTSSGFNINRSIDEEIIYIVGDATQSVPSAIEVIRDGTKLTGTSDAVQLSPDSGNSIGDIRVHFVVQKPGSESLVYSETVKAKNEAFSVNHSVAIHLDDDGHEYVAEIISENLYRSISDLKMNAPKTYCK